jgi:hypothetical protein
MSDALTIGDFSLMTHLSIKTLRYHHHLCFLYHIFHPGKLSQKGQFNPLSL